MQHYQLNRIQKQIERIKQELQKIGEMRPGSLTRQMVSQNNKRYPYYQLSYTYNMQSRTDYVKKEFARDLKRQINNYKNFKKLTKRWVDLAILHSKLKIDIASKKK
jgi:hypothetical protein